MIKTFKSTGIGNEIPFDAEEAERWRRAKEDTRNAMEKHRHSGKNDGDGSSLAFEERPGGDLDDS